MFKNVLFFIGIGSGYVSKLYGSVNPDPYNMSWTTTLVYCILEAIKIQICKPKPG